ncbi:MAG: glycosyltransferase [Flavobacteriaceae bacterium]|nr:glycosyltransferase [Flavobacteriaceae bacterium]
MERKIIVAPLNWGLGHASRCVPIIRFLLENKFTPIIASDGKALQFLAKEFPDLERLELPSYGISYAKNLKLGLLLQVPSVLGVIKEEQKTIADFILNRKDVVGIISDNRFGVRSKKAPSVYITHQIQVFSGITTFFTSKIHQNIIQKFDACWVPDTEKRILSGKLSEPKNLDINIKYIGALSRFSKQHLPIKNDILIVLSGVASQRQSLEKKLLNEFKNYNGKVVLVQGLIENEQVVKTENGIKIYNYLLSEQLQKEINQSKLVLCRSGYSSIMDLAVLQKNAFFIPTKNQPEQEYLATYLEQNNIAPFASEKVITVKSLEQIKKYKGLSCGETRLSKDLLDLF